MRFLAPFTDQDTLVETVGVGPCFEEPPDDFHVYRVDIDPKILGFVDDEHYLTVSQEITQRRTMGI